MVQEITVLRNGYAGFQPSSAGELPLLPLVHVVAAAAAGSC